MNEEIIEKYLPIIRKHFPNITVDNIRLFADGHDHYVLLVNGTKAFRFPRGEQFGNKDAIENKFFKDFAVTSPVKVQEMEEHRDNDLGMTYQTYEFITGVGFTKEVAATFSQNELQKIATHLGKFLKQLHSYPLDKAQEISMDSINSASDYLAFFEDRLKFVKKNLFPRLPIEAQQWVEKLWEVYLVTSRELFEPKVTHFDMQPVHIIVDPSQHTLSGIIDFSLRIADPARDFMYFNRYGSDFLKAAYAAYGEKDNYFDTRRQFYAGEFELLEFESALESHNEEKIGKKRQELLDYIKQFPVV